MSEDETVKADTAELVERLRAEVAAVQGEAVAWGVDTYGDLPRTLALLNGAADAISSLQDELKRVNALLTASVDDYNTALEEVKRLREARPIAVLPDDWLQHNRMRWSADFDTAILDAMDAVSLIDELLAYRGVERGPSPHDHVLVTCANGHRNWMERGDRDGWRIQEAYCATCREPLHRATR